MTTSSDLDNPQDERRRHDRAPVGIEVLMRERGRNAVAARLIDFNSFGCQLEGPVLFRSDAQIWVRLPGLESLPVNLAWKCGPRMGLEFITPLHPAVAARFMPRTSDAVGAVTVAPTPPAPPKQSRRQQILSGIAAADQSPLQRYKQPSGQGLIGRIGQMLRRAADHRAEPRYPQPVASPVSVSGAPVQVKDVSASGLRVAGAFFSNTEGAEVTVDFAGFDPIVGQLVWSNGAEAGIALPPQSLNLVEQAY